MLDELTDIEKARPLIWKARHHDIEELAKPASPQTPSTPPVASLGRTKSQRRWRGWFMALMVACALVCCGVMGWCVWVVVR